MKKSLILLLFLLSYFHADAQKDVTTSESKLSRIRISLTGQSFRTPTTNYTVPEVDSFDLSGGSFNGTGQVGILVEIAHKKNTRLATVVGLGFGNMTDSYSFRTSRDYFDTGFANQGNTVTLSGDIGNYLLAQIGLSYRLPVKKLFWQNSLSITGLVTFLDPYSFAVFDRTPDFMLPPEGPYVLEGQFDTDKTLSNLLPGIEYQTELIFRPEKRLFWGLGFVFNYTFGTVIEGSATIDNGFTAYMATSEQRFSKAGLLVKIGVNL